MRVTRLHHVQVTVPKGAESEARNFYCGLLGLAEVEKPEGLRARGGFWLDLGNAQLHVGTESGAERRSTRAHVGYEVDDLAGFRARLAKHGIAFEDGVPIPGVERAYLTDPFGNTIELVQVAD